MSRPTLLITGASSGIGAATARMSAEAGWNVGLLARRADRLDELAQEIGAQALALPGDVTDGSSLAEAARRCETHFGGIDAVFANAGMGLQTAGTEEGDPEEWRRLLDVNVLGVLNTARAVLPMLRKSRGTLVLTGSAAGRQHIKGSIYGATKWFVHGYAGNMADEMREWGGRCCVIAPGMVDTEFFDEAKPDKLHPEDVAASVLHAITAGARVDIREIALMPRD